jgi:hypothetical protein
VAGDPSPNGWAPAAQQSTVPQARTSAAPVIGSPANCSGAMDRGVPMGVPVAVMLPPSATSSALAIPK